MSEPVARLDDMIEYVIQRNPSGDPLTHLTDAVVTSEQLGDLADSLIGHFVDQARRSGASWTQIGQSMGVTKQAAQKRFVGTGKVTFERFTQRARGVLVSSQEIARAAGNGTIGTEHVLVGLLSEPEGLAFKAIAELGGSADAVRERAVATFAPAGKRLEGHIPFGSDSKDALEAAVREALGLGHNYIGTEHVLLGILTQDGAGTRVLTESGVTYDNAKELVGRMIAEIQEARSKGQGSAQ